MITRTFARFAIAASIAATPLAAAAQSAIAPGAVVVDPAGNTVGTVTAVKGAELTVKTDRHEVRLPSTSFTPHEGKLLFAMTQAQLNAETDKSIAEANAKVAVGAMVHGTGGAMAGSIEAVDETTVTVKLTSGELIRLPRNAIAPADHGVVLGVSVDELKAMAATATADSANR